MELQGLEAEVGQVYGFAASVCRLYKSIHLGLSIIKAQSIVDSGITSVAVHRRFPPRGQASHETAGSTAGRNHGRYNLAQPAHGLTRDLSVSRDGALSVL